MELTEIDFKNLRDYIQGIIGLSIQDDKRYLIIQRLEPVARACGCRNFAEFYLKLREKKDPELNDRIIGAITTNETSFFRDIHPFKTFREKVLPVVCDWIRDRKSRLYMRRGPKAAIWCAAASTGQEPYSLAMSVLDAVGGNKVPGVLPEDFSIIATDVSAGVLAKAISGRYDKMEIARGLPEDFRRRFFREEKDVWVIHEDIQKLVDFRRLNLVESFQFLGGFDVIFCRNVLIYFDIKTRAEIFDQFYHMLNEEGYLFLGASENIFGTTDKFESHHFGRTIIYKKNPTARGPSPGP